MVCSSLMVSVKLQRTVLDAKHSDVDGPSVLTDTIGDVSKKIFLKKTSVYLDGG